MKTATIFKQVHKRLHNTYPNSHAGMRCIYWMHSGLIELSMHGIRCSPMAGSAGFLMDPDAPEPQPTHLSYQWGGANDSERRVADNYDPATAMPECHCWIWLPDSKEVVDFSAGELPMAAARLGLTWHRENPPDYYWNRPQVLAPYALYMPHRDATKYVLGLISHTPHENADSSRTSI